MCLTAVTWQNGDAMRFGREGAGVLVVARSTSRLLLLRRSSEVLEPGAWGIPGGRVDSSEEPRETATRELGEETGYDGEVEMSQAPLMVYEEDDGAFRYSTFIGFVADEFGPELNWESDDAGWFTFDALPEPLHFGVEELFRKGRKDIEFLIRTFKPVVPGPMTTMKHIAVGILSDYMSHQIAADVAGNALYATSVGVPPAEAIESTIRHRMSAGARATKAGPFPQLSEDQIAAIVEAIETDDEIAAAFAQMQSEIE